MIRKLLVTASVAILPVTGLAGAALVASSGTAGAGAPVVAPLNCAISGSIDFAGAGIETAGNVNLTDKTNTAVTHLSGTGTGCQSTQINQNIVQKSTKCSVTTLGSALVLGFTLTPAATTFPGCEPVGGKASKDYQYDSAWGFVGGVLVNGSTSSSTAGIAAALKKGIVYDDSGVALTLLVPANGVTAVLPGGTCGTGAGFDIAGTIKKSPATWALHLCLSGDSGTNTTGTFLSDIATEALHTVAGNWDDSGSPIAIKTGVIDSSVSTLVVTP